MLIRQLKNFKNFVFCSGVPADLVEKLRKKRLQELEMQQRVSDEQAEMQEQKMRELEEQKRNLLRQILTVEARERLANIRLAKPEFVDGIEQQLIMIAQSGQIALPINDDMLKQLLQKLMGKKKEIKITRISK